MPGGFSMTFKELRAGFARPASILAKVEKANARVQAKFGAYVRRRMKSSIKYKDSPERRAILAEIDRERALGAAANRFRVAALRERLKRIDDSAPAGQPPYAHRSGGFSRAKVNKKTGATTRQQQSPLRELIFFALEPGGGVVIGPVAFGRRGAGALEKGGTTTTVRNGTVRTVRVAPHPFAAPAGAAEAKNLNQLLKDMAT